MDVIKIGTFMTDTLSNNIITITSYSPRTNTYGIKYRKPGMEIQLNHISESELIDNWTFMNDEQIALWRTLYEG